MTEKRYLPEIDDENVARAVGRLQSHEDMQVFLDWLENEARPHAITQFRGKLEHEVLIKWATTLQVIDDILATNRNAHEVWARIRAEKFAQKPKWEG
jgi:tellurite resistance protein